MIMDTIHLILLVNLILSCATLAVVVMSTMRVKVPRVQRAVPAGSCGGHSGSCGATDPVLDPRYNLVQIAKQCVLLEEHLLIEAKYCQDCCAKHLLHINGLAEEAEGLAGGADLVALHDTVRGSQAALLMWEEARSQDGAVPIEARKEIAVLLRSMRKEIMANYM